MQAYNSYPICRNCYTAFLQAGGGIERTNNRVYRRRMYAAGLPLCVDDNQIPCSVCEEPFKGSPFPDYDLMHWYMLTEDEILEYFVDVLAVPNEA